MNRERLPETLSVDMVRCAGHGICAWLFPDRVRLDEWGFAEIDHRPITDKDEQQRAQHAVRACPRRALHVNDAPTPSSGPTVSS